MAALLAAALAGGCASPADVVRDAAEAARRGDRAAFAALFTRRSRPLLRAWWRAAEATRPELGRLAAGAVEVLDVRDLPPSGDGTRRARVTVAEAGEELPLVLHGAAWAWRIDLIDTERVLTGLGGPF